MNFFQFFTFGIFFLLGSKLPHFRHIFRSKSLQYSEGDSKFSNSNLKSKFEKKIENEDFKIEKNSEKIHMYSEISRIYSTRKKEFSDYFPNKNFLIRFLKNFSHFKNYYFYYSGRNSRLLDRFFLTKCHNTLKKFPVVRTKSHVARYLKNSKTKTSKSWKNSEKNIYSEISRIYLLNGKKVLWLFSEFFFNSYEFFF